MNKEQELLIFRRASELFGVSTESVFGIICNQGTSAQMAESEEKLHIMGSTPILLQDMTAADEPNPKYSIVLLAKSGQIKLAADEIIMKAVIGVNDELQVKDSPKFWYLHIKYT